MNWGGLLSLDWDDLLCLPLLGLLYLFDLPRSLYFYTNTDILRTICCSRVKENNTTITIVNSAQQFQVLRSVLGGY